jgi:hypothetical protein
MTDTNEELAIREALATMTTGQPSIPPGRYAAVRRRAVVNRRRRLASVAVAVAILVAVAVAIPLGWLRMSTPPPPQAPRYHVTLMRPAKGSPRSLVASGRLDSLRWRAAVTQRPGEVCWSGTFDRGTETGCSGGAPATMSPTGYPVGNLTATFSPAQIDFATVRADVTDVEIAYSNGQMLTAFPRAVFASRYARYVAFAAPFDAAVTRITAFSKRGAIAYAVPFTASADIGITVERWLRPDQQPLPQPAHYLAGTGVTDGRRWRDTVYVGPWGTCFVHPLDASGSRAVNCFPSVEWLQGHPQVAQVVGAAFQSGLHLGFLYGQAEPAVQYLIVTTAHGRTDKVIARSAGGRRFFAFVSKDSDPAARWAAYGAAGNELASGPVPSTFG